MKRPAVIVALFVVGLIAAGSYFVFTPPPGVEPMGGDDATVAWVSLTVAVVSMLTALIGLVQKVIELRAAARANQ